MSAALLLALSVLAAQPAPAGPEDDGASIARLYADPGVENVPAAPSDPIDLVRASGRDEPDVTSERQTHLVYFVPRDKPDEGLDGAIRDSVRSLRAWFSAQMGLRPRIDRLSSGAYDITFVRGQLDARNYPSLDSIADELQNRGFNRARKRYLIYAALNMGDVCGEGFYPLTRDVETNYAAVYLDSHTGCGARDFGDGSADRAGKADGIAVHEWLHNEQIVPAGSPRHCSSVPFHVCTGASLISDLDPEAPDVMFPYNNRRLASKQLDRNRDDYLDHELPIADLRDSLWLCSGGADC